MELEFTQPQYTVLENELFAVLVVKIRNGFLNRSVSYSVTPNSLQATGKMKYSIFSSQDVALSFRLPHSKVLK